MAESGAAGAAAEKSPAGVDPMVAIDALRARGADRFDPVRLRFIEALARRAAAQRDHARRVVDGRLATAVAEFGARFEHAEGEAAATLGRALAQFPAAGDALRECFATGDFGALQRLHARLEAQQGSTPLAGLLAHIGRYTQDGGGGAPDQTTAAVPGAQGELKSVRYFRRTWSRLNVEQQLSRAFAHAPANAGPLNSHFLVLQSLRQMRSLSVEYVEQYMSYVDALLWLDQADSNRSAAKKVAVRGERDKKRKAGRGDGG